MAPVSATVVGGPAVPFALADASGVVHRLDDYRGGWLLLVFHRHLGCPPCRGHLDNLRKHEQRLRDLDVQVAVVSFTGGSIADGYAQETGLSWPTFIDEERQLYTAYGMFRGTRWNI